MNTWVILEMNFSREDKEETEKGKGTDSIISTSGKMF